MCVMCVCVWGGGIKMKYDVALYVCRYGPCHRRPRLPGCWGWPVWQLPALLQWPRCVLREVR